MSYEIQFIDKSSYLHVVVTGQNRMENVLAYLQRTLQECKERGQTRVLIEENLQGPRLNVMDVFLIASEGSKPALGILTAIAYVDVNAEGDLMRFAETVTVNRALPAAVFNTVEEAKNWLIQLEHA